MIKALSKILAVLVAVNSWLTVHAQPNAVKAPEESMAGSFIRGTKLFTGLHLEYWSYRGTSSFETVLPVYYSMDLKQYLSGLSVDLVSSPVIGVLAGEGVTGNDPVMGLSNAKVRTSYNFNNLFLGTFGIQVPTGANEMSVEQKNTLSALGERNYHFRVGQIGSGLNLDFTISSSMEISDDFVIGAGLGVLTRGPYKPYETSNDYNPGEEFSLALGADYTAIMGERKYNITGDVIMMYYTTDKNDSKDYYKSGMKINATLSGGTKINPRLYNTVNLVLVYRSSGKYENGADYSPGSELMLSNYVHFIQNKKFRPFALGRTFFFGSNEFSSGGAFTLGAGGGGSLRLSNLLSARAELILDGGMMDSDFVFGTEINGGLHYDF